MGRGCSASTPTCTRCAGPLPTSGRLVGVRSSHASVASELADYDAGAVTVHHGKGRTAELLHVPYAPGTLPCERSPAGVFGASLLLPEAPDATAARLRRAIAARTGAHIGVVISDSSNRPWRLGTVGIAIGAAGLAVLDDRRGSRDLYGRRIAGPP